MEFPWNAKPIFWKNAAGFNRYMSGRGLGLKQLPSPGMTACCKKEYKVWTAMFDRCYNEKHPAYNYYGGRGIKVCPRWRSFYNFMDDMGPRPDGLTLERVNNMAGYGPKNCKWATYTEQANNRRNNIKKLPEAAK